MHAADSLSSAVTPSKTLHITLWVFQVLLAAAFMMAGLFKLTTPVEELVAAGMLTDPTLLRIAGASEVAGALGLILPSATRILPKLTPLAASLLALVMILAVGTHVMAGDPIKQSLPALALSIPCLFVAWGRLKKAPIAPKGA